jgi:hypothetical protein
LIVVQYLLNGKIVFLVAILLREFLGDEIYKGILDFFGFLCFGYFATASNSNLSTIEQY